MLNRDSTDKVVMPKNEQRAELEKLLSLVVAPVIICDIESQDIVFCNESAHELTGYDSSSLNKMKIMDIFHRDFFNLVNAIFEIAKKNEDSIKVKEDDLIIQRRSGRLCDVSISVATTKTNSKKWLVMTIHDLTEIHRQELERQHLIEETGRVSKLADIGRLAAGIAHELNNPLAILMGYLENIMGNIQSGEAKIEDVIDDLIPIERAAQRMSRVISQMLAKMRNEPTLLKPTSLKKVVEDSLTLFEGIFSSLGVRVEIEISEDWILCDNAGIEQIITNIVTNACNALEGQNNRQLKFQSSTQSGRVTLEVWNNGSPIPDGVKAKLFTPFFTTRAVGEGTGLGLYMSYQIMKAHQGEISFRSDANSGTSFFMTFPLIKKPGLMADPGGLRALIVDDDTFFRKLMRRKLEKFGVECVEAKDGYEALTTLRSSGNSLDMVLLDFKMPRMDGLQLINQLKDEKIDVPVILISGALSVSDLEIQTLKHKLFATMSKPVRMSELEAVIDKVAADILEKRKLTAS